MTPTADLAAEPPTAEHSGDEAASVEAALDFGERLPVGIALADRGLDLASLSAGELDELTNDALELLSPVLDQIAEHWQDEHGNLSDQDKIDRELRRRITSEKAAIVEFYSDGECDGCGSRSRNSDAFVRFHGLYLCDGCEGDARDVLRDIQQPQIKVLEAEPTLEHASALGFELARRDDGRLTWIGEDDDYDGGTRPYADEQEALADLVDELAVGL